MKKKFLALILTFTMSFGVISCSNKAEKETNSQPLKTLSVGVLPALSSFPLIIAEHNGYFKEEGLQVKIEHFKSASDKDAALQTKKIDGSMTDMLSVVFFNDNNFDVKITSKTESIFKLISGKASDISKIDQTPGKSIGLSKNTLIEYLTDRILESSNVDVNSIKKVSIPLIPTRLEMLTNGKLDMATFAEPYASTAIAAGGNVLGSSDKLGINTGVMAFTQESVSSKSEEIKSFYRAYNKAVEYTKKAKLESYIDYVIKEADLPPSVKNTLADPSYTKASMPPEKELQEVLTWLKAKKLTTNSYTLKDLSNSSFIE